MSQVQPPGDAKGLPGLAALPVCALSALFYYAGAAAGITIGVFNVLAVNLIGTKAARQAQAEPSISALDPATWSRVKPEDEPAVHVPAITAIPEQSIAVEDTHSSVSGLIQGLPLVHEEEQQPLFQTSPGGASEEAAEEPDHLVAEDEIKQALQQLSAMHPATSGYLPQSTDAVSEGGASHASSNGGSRTGAARALADGLAIPGSNRRKASTRKAPLR